MTRRRRRRRRPRVRTGPRATRANGVVESKPRIVTIRCRRRATCFEKNVWCRRHGSDSNPPTTRRGFSKGAVFFFSSPRVPTEDRTGRERVSVTSAPREAPARRTDVVFVEFPRDTCIKPTPGLTARSTLFRFSSFVRPDRSKRDHCPAGRPVFVRGGQAQAAPRRRSFDRGPCSRRTSVIVATGERASCDTRSPRFTGIA